jgi:hypothetical protein
MFQAPARCQWSMRAIRLAQRAVQDADRGLMIATGQAGEFDGSVEAGRSSLELAQKRLDIAQDLPRQARVDRVPGSGDPGLGEGCVPRAGRRGSILRRPRPRTRPASSDAEDREIG